MKPFGRLILFAFFLCAFPAAILSAQDAEQNQARATELYRQIRCPVCQAQTIDGSDTDVAKDLRAYVLKKLENGESDDDILNGLRNAYGDSIIMIPPVTLQTAPLWFAPVLIFICGLGFAGFLILQKGKSRT